jgi:hypothetical protein
LGTDCGPSSDIYISALATTGGGSFATCDVYGAALLSTPGRFTADESQFRDTSGCPCRSLDGLIVGDIPDTENA